MISNNVIATVAAGLLARLRHDLDYVLRVEDEAIREAYTADLKQAEEALSAMQQEERKIATNADLSAAGQTKAMIELAQATVKRLAFLGQRAKTVGQAYDAEHADLLALPPAPKGEPVVAYLREQEVRTYLRSLTLSQVMTAYIKAVENGDNETIRAIKLSPGAPLIDASFIERVDIEQGQLTKTARWTRLQSLEARRDGLRSLNDQVQAMLGGYGKEPTFPTPPIRQAQHLVSGGDPVKPSPANF